MEREFTVIVERDLDSGWLMGSIMDLPGCFTAAPDEATLRVYIQEALELYIECASEILEQDPEFVGTFTVRAEAPSAA